MSVSRLGRASPFISVEGPAHLVEDPGREAGRDRFLTPDEIRAIWLALEDAPPLTRAAFRVALLTAQRIDSVCTMRWDQIAGDIWTIPAKSFKGKRDHLVPLSGEAMELLEWCRPWSSSTWILPSRAGTSLPHIRNLSSNALVRARNRAGIPHWTLHDFRTTFRTHATRPAKTAVEGEPAGLGVTAEIAAAVLGHKGSSLGFSRYTGDKSRYLIAEKREALQRWGTFVRDTVEVDG